MILRTILKMLTRLVIDIENHSQNADGYWHNDIDNHSQNADAVGSPGRRVAGSVGLNSNQVGLRVGWFKLKIADPTPQARRPRRKLCPFYR